MVVSDSQWQAGSSRPLRGQEGSCQVPAERVPRRLAQIKQMDIGTDMVITRSSVFLRQRG